MTELLQPVTMATGQLSSSIVSSCLLIQFPGLLLIDPVLKVMAGIHTGDDKKKTEVLYGATVEIS